MAASRWSGFAVIAAAAACGRVGFDPLSGPDAGEFRAANDCHVPVVLPIAPGARVEAAAGDASRLVVAAVRGDSIELVTITRDGDTLHTAARGTVVLPAHPRVALAIRGPLVLVVRSDTIQATAASAGAMLDDRLEVQAMAEDPVWGVDSLTAVDEGVLAVGRERDGRMLARVLDTSGEVIHDGIRPEGGNEWQGTNGIAVMNGARLAHDHRGTGDVECDLELLDPINNPIGYVAQGQPCEAAAVAYNATLSREAAAYQGRDGVIRGMGYSRLQADMPEHDLDRGRAPQLVGAGDGFTAAYVTSLGLAVRQLDLYAEPIALAQIVDGEAARFWLTPDADARITWATNAGATTMRLCR